MKKSQIIIFGAAGLLSFIGTFGLTWFFGGSDTSSETVAIQGQQGVSADGEGGFDITSIGAFEDDKNLSKGMTEKQLQTLIYDIREKMKEHRYREKELALEDSRIASARDTLQEDIERLNKLRDELTSILSNLKAQEASLAQARLKVLAAEKENIQKMAGMYDKMDVTQSSQILMSMATNDQFDDAVKILHYMTDRTSAKLLGEIGKNQATLAAAICDKLKRIEESE